MKLIVRYAASVTLCLFLTVVTALSAPSLVLQLQPGTPVGPLAKKYGFQIVRGLQSSTRGPAFVITGQNLDGLKASLSADPAVEWIDDNSEIRLVSPLDESSVVRFDTGETVTPVDGSTTVVPLGPGITTVDKATILNALKSVMIRVNGEYFLPLDSQTVMTVDQIQQAYEKLAGLVTGSPALLLQPAFGKVALYGAILQETGRGVTIANLDTGADSCHEALQGIFTRSFVDNGAPAPEDCPGPATVTIPAYGHGTAVASLLRMMAPEATLWALRIFDASGAADVATVYEATVWATGHGANVINMSFGSPNRSVALQNAVDYAASHGVLISGAAGNSGIDQVMYPAGIPPTLGTAAVDIQDRKASFSNYNQSVVVSAPGVKILVAYPGHQYATVSGTSFASPLTGGNAAMTLESWLATHHGPGATDAVRSAVVGGVDEIYSLNPQKFQGLLGSGRINLWKSYRLAIQP